MTWHHVTQLGSLVILVVTAVAGLPALVVHLSRRYGADDLQIGAIRYIKGYEKADESLPRKAAQRRALAYSHHRIGRKIAAGEGEF